MSDTANMRQDYRSPRDGVDFAADSPFPDQSAKHASHAVDHLIAATNSKDSRTRDAEVELAKVWATLSLRDKLDEVDATIRLCANRLIDSQQKLDTDIQTAAQHLHKDAQDLRAHLRVVVNEEAA